MLPISPVFVLPMSSVRTPRLPARLGEHLKKKPAVIVITEDRFPAISSRHHVVVSSDILDSNASYHE